MAKTRWSLSEAKDHFSELVDAAREGAPQTVTRHGRAAVVVVKAEDFERLTGAGAAPKKSFLQHLMDMPDNGQEFERIPAKPRDVEF